MAKQSLDEGRTEFLFLEIKRLSQESKPIELLIGAKPENYRQLAERMAKVGKVTRIYNNIPYFSIECSPVDADIMARRFHSHDRSSGLERELGSDLDMIVAIDVASTYKIIPAGRQSSNLVYKTDQLWNLANIGAYAAQKMSRGSGVKIGIIDTGIEYTHQELKGVVAKELGHNFVDGTSDAMDDNGHGTHVSGITAGATVGVSIDSRLIPLKALDHNGSGPETNVISGIDWAIDYSLDVVNLSLGARYASKAFEAICNVGYSKGLTIVAAAGNEEYGPSYPAAFGKPVIAVAAVDRNNDHAWFSNVYGTNDISAPGVAIVSSYLNNTYEALDGTSMATPHVTGVIGLAIAAAKNYSGSIEEAMGETAKHLPNSLPYEDQWVFGSGLVQADSLVSKVMQNQGIRNMIMNKMGRR